MRRIRAIISVTLLVAGTWRAVPVFSQAAPLPPGTRTISVSGHGDAKAKPDKLVISFSVESKAPSGDECTKLQSEKTGKVVDALKGKLGGKGEVATSNFSLSPITESVPIAANAAPTPPGIPWGFTESIQATTDKLESVGTLIDAAMAAGATRVSQTNMEEMPVNLATGRIEPNARMYPNGMVSALNAVGRATSEPQKTGSYYETRQLPSVTFEIQAEGATAGEAVRQGAELSHRVERALKDKLGNTGVTQVTNFNVNQVNPDNPNQPYAMRRQFMPPQDQTKQSFVAHTNIDVKTGQMDLLGPLLEAAMAAGASQLNSVSFTLGSDAAARKEAIAVASREAQTKAEIAANSMGVKLGNVLSISVNGEVQPQVIYGNSFGHSGAVNVAMMARRMPVMPHEVGFAADVNAVYEIH